MKKEQREIHEKAFNIVTTMKLSDKEGASILFIHKNSFSRKRRGASHQRFTEKDLALLLTEAEKRKNDLIKQIEVNSPEKL